MNKTIPLLLDINYCLEHGISVNTILFNFDIKENINSQVMRLIEQKRQPLIEQDFMLVAIVNNQTFRPILGNNDFQIFEMECKKKGDTIYLTLLPTALVYSGITDCEMICEERARNNKIFVNV